MKKQSAGFFLTLISAVLAAAGLVFYFINCQTNYFRALGSDARVIACAAVAILAQVLLLVAAQKGQKPWMDVLPVAAPVLLVVSTLLFLSARVNGIAAIMTFTNNAQNRADLQSAIIGMVCLLLATLVGVVAAFFDVTKS